MLPIPVQTRPEVLRCVSPAGGDCRLQVRCCRRAQCLFRPICFSSRRNCASHTWCRTLCLAHSVYFCLNFSLDFHCTDHEVASSFCDCLVIGLCFVVGLSSGDHQESSCLGRAIAGRAIWAVFQSTMAAVMRPRPRPITMRVIDLISALAPAVPSSPRPCAPPPAPHAPTRQAHRARRTAAPAHARRRGR